MLPNDVYVVMDRGTRQIYHVGETMQGGSVRGDWWVRHLKNEYGINAIVAPTKRLQLPGKAIGRQWETRYIQTYEKIFGRKPHGVDSAGKTIQIQKTDH